MMLQAGPVTMPVKCESGATHEWSLPSNVRTSIDGTRWATRAPRASMDLRLTFDLSRPSDHATVLALVHGEFGPGPFALLDATAAVTNALPAATSLLDHLVGVAGVGSVSGAYALAGGAFAGRTLINPPTLSVTQGPARAAIAPAAGQTVTVSIFGYGAGGSVRIAPIWYTAAGASVTGTYVSTPTQDATLLARVAATFNVPATVTPSGGSPVPVHRIGIGVQNATRMARPAVTHTRGVTEWGVGAGLRAVHLHPPSASTIKALANPKGLRASTVTLTASEVGPA